MKRLVWAFSVVWAAGCVSGPLRPQSLATARVAGDFDSYRLERVGLLPVAGSSRNPGGPSDLQEAFFAEVTQSADFEVVPLDLADLAEIPESQAFRRGWYDPRTIIELARRFKLDALLVATVTQLREYPPQILSVELELVSAETGMVLWAASVQLDASDRRVLSSLDYYLQDRGGESENIGGRELCLLSPSRFARFAAYEVARLL